MSVLKKVFAMVSALFFSASVLTGCGGNKSDGGGNNKDTIIFAQSQDVKGLDPAFTEDVYSSNVLVNIYETLVKYKDSEKAELEGCLAESWTISEDGLTYTFKLRKNIKFHDGSEFNAEAVKFNIDRQTGNAPKINEMPYANLIYGNVESAKVIDNSTIEIKLKKVDSVFLSKLTLTSVASMASPKTLKEKNNDLNRNPAGAGTGPYKFESWEQDRNITLTRNDEYWGEKAKTKNILIKTMTETDSRIGALNNNEIDVCASVERQKRNQVTDNGNKIYEHKNLSTFYMAYNTTSKSVCKDAKVRRAITQSIDTKTMVPTLEGNPEAKPPNSFMHSSLNGYSKDIQQVAYDPEAAKKALADLGVKKLKILCCGGGGSPSQADFAASVQEYLKKVGVEASIETVGTFKEYTKEAKKKEYDMCFFGWAADYPDAENFLFLATKYAGDMSASGYDNSEYNAMYDKAMAMPVGAERNAVFTEMEKKLAEEAVHLPLRQEVGFVGYSSKLQNFKLNLMGQYYFAKIYKES